MMMINFDDIDNWEPLLTDKLKPLIPTTLRDRVIDGAPKTIQDALNLLLDSTCDKALIDAAIGWVRSATVAGYHGTRLTETEVDSVRTKGLLPMKADQRRARLQRALSCHERWPEAADRLDDKLRAFGPGEKAGRREGQVHLTLSRSGLISGFNQYLTHGAEIDYHIAFKLLGQEGVDLLAKDGEAKLIKVAVPGHKALEATNRYRSVEVCQATNKVPNLIGELLGSWSYKLAKPRFQCRSSQSVDCGMIFYSTVPSDWITKIETYQAP